MHTDKQRRSNMTTLGISSSDRSLFTSKNAEIVTWY
jgi:hypothetical protein